MPYITVVGEAAGESLCVGQVVALSAVETAADKEAVAAMVDGQAVGWVANSETTVIAGTLGASDVRKKWLEDKRCASMSAVLRKEDVFTNRAGNQQRRFYAEPYLVPARAPEDDASNAKPVREYTVGGTTAQNPKKTKVQEIITVAEQANKEPDTELIVNQIVIGSKTRICVFFPDDTSAGSSCGDILNADPELHKLIAAGGQVSATVLKGLPDGTYSIAVSADPKKPFSRFYPAIDRAVARCVAQSPTLERRVQHMEANNFSDELIEAVLDQMPTLGNERADVPKPKTPYQQISGFNLSDLVAYMLKGKLVRLVGEKGSGKNTLAETACWLLGRPLCRIQGSAETEKMDFQGARTLKDGSTGFELSEMLTTLKNDGVVVVDEANMIRPDVLSLLHSLTDGARAINVPGYGTVHMGDHACVIYTLNESYVGTGEMNPATIDRGPTILIEQEADMSVLLAAAVPAATPDDITICCNIASGIRKAVRESGQLTSDAETIRGYIDALESQPYVPLKRALLQNVAYKAQSQAERLSIETIISTFIP